MLRRISAGLALAIGLAAGSAAAAEPPRECTDDNLTDRCSVENRGKQRALFGEGAIETFQTSRAVVRRAFIVDGYGNDVVAVTFERLPGKDARLRVRPRRYNADGTDSYVEMEAVVPLAVWNDVIARSENFDRQLVPLPVETDEGRICLHAWIATVEALDADGSVRQRTQNACGDGLAVDYAFVLAAVAVKLLPWCDALTPNQFRNDPNRLQTCGALEGDRLSAALAVNSYLGSKLTAPGGVGTESSLWADLGSMVTLSWPGDPLATGFRAVSEAWVAKFAGLHQPNLDFHRVNGVNSTQAVLEGNLTYDVEGSRSYYEAPLKMVWQDQGDGDYEVVEIVVGAFQLVKGE